MRLPALGQGEREAPFPLAGPAEVHTRGLVPGEAGREFFPIVEIARLGAKAAIRPVGHIGPDHFIFQIHHLDILSGEKRPEAEQQGQLREKTFGHKDDALSVMGS